MFQFLFGALDFLADIPRSVRAWLIGLGIAGVIVGVSLAIDRFGPW